MMSAMTVSSDAGRTSRTLLVLSIALNLFFVGVACAFAVRQYAWKPPVPAEIDRTPNGRIERVAASLPKPDGDILRAVFRARAVEVDAAYDHFRLTSEHIRVALRAEPYDYDAALRAMIDARTARRPFEQGMQEVIATAAGQMSPAGRSRLAELTPSARGAPKTPKP